MPKKKKRSAWISHVMKEFKKNKAAGFSAALRRSKATWNKKKKTVKK